MQTQMIIMHSKGSIQKNREEIARLNGWNHSRESLAKSER
jgi:hypothetical protein